MYAAFAAMQAIPQMTHELREINEDETLTDRERGQARGGAIGEASGTIAGYAAGGAIGTAVGIKAGAAAGAKIGAALGTVVPGVGNVIGLVAGGLIGAGVGWLGGRAGRAIGEGVGGVGHARPEADTSTVTAGREERTATSPPQWPTAPLAFPMSWTSPAPQMLAGQQLSAAAETVAPVPAPVPRVDMDGEIRIESHLSVEGGALVLRQELAGNTSPFRFATGSTAEARVIQ